MSDLISRSELLKEIEKYKFGAISNNAEREYVKTTILNFIECQPTAYDPDKVVEELEERKALHERLVDYETKNGTVTEKYQHIKAIDILNDAIEIVKQEAEQCNNGWIPCSDDSAKLPKENENVRVTVWTGIERIGFRQYGKWYTYTSEGIGEATVVAWQPTEPFKERD